MSLQELVNELMRIREAVEMIEVKGQQNRALANFIYDSSSNMINRVNQLLQELQKQDTEKFNGPVPVEQESEETMEG